MTDSVQETERTTPVVATCDVVVAGGGPAGVVAALAAARRGARVALLDVGGCLGGVWTVGSLCWVIDAANKGGIMAEIATLLDERGARTFRQEGAVDWAYDPEEMKLLLDELCAGAGVRVQLHTRVVAAMRSDGAMTHLLTESKSGRQAWYARTFIDCTGDGDLAAQAGCGFDVGHPETGRVQPMSLPCIVTGLDRHAVEMYTGGGKHEPKVRFLEACQQAGVDPSYHPPVLMRIHDDMYVMIVDHQYQVDASDAAAVTAATANARREIHQLMNALRASGGVWRDLRLIATAAHIGVREGRRIHGRARMCMDDMLIGNHPPDSIATCAFGFDVHATNGIKTRGFEQPDGKPKPYGLPLRALIAADVDGLLMAGRCVSGDFFAHSSYRVTGDAAAMGQAAGTCAARAAEQDVRPHEVDCLDIKDRLRADGCVVP